MSAVSSAFVFAACWGVFAMLVADDTDASIRLGLAGIVFAILANVDRRANR